MASSISLQLFESMTTGRLVAAGFFVVLGSFIVDFTWKPQYPRSLPRTGNGGGVMGTLRDWFGYIFHHNDWVHEGYIKVRTCMFATILLQA
jgi:hypothetical protein